MATNPTLQSVLLFAHHQNTTPYMPHVTAGTRRQPQGTLGQSAPAEQPKPGQEEENAPLSDGEEDDQEDDQEEDDG